MTIISINPATGDVLYKGMSAGIDEINKAFALARETLPSWKTESFDKRCDHLKAFAKKLEENKDAFAELISKEVGKPFWEAKTEVAAMIAKVDISIEAYLQRCPPNERQLKEALSITRYAPHGVVVVFGPYNFPGHLPNGHIVPALLAGNTVIFKPSEKTPLVGEKLVELWHKSGLPKGVLQLVQGDKSTGELLSTHKDLDALLFTGSYPVGKILSAYFGQHPEKLLALELGGNNPLCVGNVTDLDTCADLIIQSAFITSGQRCSCSKRLIVLEKDAEKLIETLIGKIQKISIGPYNAEPEPFMGPMINEKAALDILQKQNELIAIGAKPLLPVKQLQGPYLSPGLLDVTEVENCPDEEIFGPLLKVTRVSSFDEAIAEAGNTRFGLCAGLLSEDHKEWERFVSEVKAGVINWNRPTTGASSSAPFGGRNCSGNSRPAAFFAADFCSVPIASFENPLIQKPINPIPGLASDNIKL